MSFRSLHAFADPSLLQQALTHPSYQNEAPGVPTYQRLEFLGDVVLQLVVSELLLERFPTWDEGSLSKARALLVDRKRCAALAENLGLGGALRAERGLAGGVAAGSKVMADVFEALVGAIYRDAGLERARAVLTPMLAPVMETLASEGLKDAKSELQEWCQARGLALPEYVAHGHTGPDHARRYEVEVFVAGTGYGQATGSSKKIAQVAAAALALRKLAPLEPAPPAPPEPELDPGGR
jgi:ribonuclease-3